MGDTFAGFETTSAEEAGFDADRLARISGYMDQAVSDGALPGAVTVVLRGGRVAHTRDGKTRHRAERPAHDR